MDIGEKAPQDEAILPSFHVAAAGWDPLSKSGGSIQRAFEGAQERMSEAKARQKHLEDSEGRWKQLHMSMYNPTVAVPRAAREASRRSVSTIGHYERSEQDHDDSERNLVVDWRGSPAQGDEDGGQAGGAFLTDLPEMQGDLPGGDAREGVWKTNFFVLGFMTEVLRNLEREIKLRRDKRGYLLDARNEETEVKSRERAERWNRVRKIASGELQPGKELFITPRIQRYFSTRFGEL